jgi:hypothetical protein
MSGGDARSERMKRGNDAMIIKSCGADDLELTSVLRVSLRDLKGRGLR